LSKESTLFVCQECGATHPRWQGRCLSCGEWNSIIAETIVKSPRRAIKDAKKAIPIPITEVPDNDALIFPSGIGEMDHVLGKGFVEGAIILLGGEPGIGKSTLALQLANTFAANETVLYISGEESAKQIQLRASRLGAMFSTLSLLIETNLQNICQIIEETKPKLVILDSIQVVYHPAIPSIPGSVNQVRHCASELSNTIKEVQAVGILIGHITKDGALAGPKVLEHLVDVILVLDGERGDDFRTLRSYKNRFASTNEVGLFDIGDTGFQAVENPYFVAKESAERHSGSIVSCINEGSRAFLLEIQALVVHTGFGMGKRTFLGVDPNRANLLIAAIEKILGIKLSDKDIILNIVGGAKSSDPGLDLALVFAMISSLYERPLPNIGICGEISLTGEIRPVKHIDKRISELSRMGFDKCIIPDANRVKITKKVGITPVYVSTLRESLDIFLNYE